jgi:hypothetical protein
MVRAPTATRWTTTLLALTTWFLLSNHCALGSLAPPAESTPEVSGCPMHSAPAKKNPAAKTPCCKDLRALVAKCVKAASGAGRLIGARDYAEQIFRAPARVAIEVQGLDTGPPGCFSFAESVLQESMLSHAPPVS